MTTNVKIKRIEKLAENVIKVGLKTTAQNKQLIAGIFVIGCFLIVFFSIMISFIYHAETCFTKNGSINKTDSDFTISGSAIASFGIISGFILFILCGFILYNFKEFQNTLIGQ